MIPSSVQESRITSPSSLTYAEVKECCRIRIRNRIKSNKQDPDPHQSGKLDPDADPQQFADDKLKCLKYEPIWALFKVLSRYLEARNRIRIRIKSERFWIQIRIRFKVTSRIRIRIKVTSRIWIRIRVMRMRNTGLKHEQLVCHLVRITMVGGRLAGSNNSFSFIY